METILPVLIAITASARQDDGQDEPMGMLTSGTLKLDGGRAVLSYEETLDESLPPQPVTVTVEGDTVSMSRSGAFETSMVFCKGRRFEGQYRTPLGEMELAVYCTRLKADIGAEGGDILLGYQLDLNGQFASMNELELRVMPQNE